MRPLQEVMRRLLVWNGYLYVRLYKGCGWRQGGEIGYTLNRTIEAVSGRISLSHFSLIVRQIPEQIHTHRSRVVILSGEGLNLYKNPRVNLSA